METAVSSHRVAVVRYPGAVHGWVLSLPGCVAGAPTADALDEPVRLAIADYLGWLRSHDEQPPDDVRWEVVEDLDGSAFAETGGEFCFDDDRRPMSRGEVLACTRLLRYARGDLVGATEHLHDEVLDWAPPREAFERFDAWAPNVRTIRDVAHHVLELEVYYRCDLQDGPSKGIFEPVASALEEHQTTVYRLRRADPARIYRPIRPGRSAEEPWTVRKAFRRLISHERIHTAEIWQRRSWLTVGIPRGGQTDGFGDEA